MSSESMQLGRAAAAPTPRHEVFRVDKFKVPGSARAEFLERVRQTHEFLRTLPGFIHDGVLEQTEGPGHFNIVTIVRWQSREAVDDARVAVTRRHREMGFDPRETMSRLGVEADVGYYQELLQRGVHQDGTHPEHSLTNPPIGLWLRRADEAITARSNEALSGLDLTRLQWQVLNVIHQGVSVTTTELRDLMGTFVDETGLDHVLDVLRDRGWLFVSSSSSVVLTPAGREGHAAARAIQETVREQTMAGISEHEYATMVRVLQGVVHNLRG